jgi:hypothetical protein
MRDVEYFGFTFTPLSSEVVFSSSTKGTSSRIEFTLDAADQNILFINKKYAICAADHWRLSKTQKRVRSVTLEITSENGLTHSGNSAFVKYWKLEQCVGQMYVYQHDTKNYAGCELKVWIPPRNLRVLRQQLLGGKLPDFIAVSLRTPLAIGTLDFGIAPDGSDKVLEFDSEDGIQVPIYSASFGYKTRSETTEQLEED